MGRPLKLTSATQQLICEKLKKGMTRDRASRRAGVHPATFHRWMAEGERHEAGKFREFREAVIAAEDEYVESLHDDLNELRGEHHEPGIRLRATTFVASHRFPGDFGRRQEVVGAGGGPVQVAAAVVVAPLVSNEAMRDATPDQVAAAVAAFLGQPPIAER